MNKIVVFTIASKNYIAYVRTLFDSVKNLHGNDMDYYLLLADENEGEFDKTKEGYEVIEAKNIGITDFTAMSFKYDVLEFNTFLKPYFMKYLFENGYQKVVYFDPDIRVFNRIDLISNLLDIHSILLTPHIITPHSADEKISPLDRSYLISGIFNLGFIGISDSKEALNFLDWWSERLSDDCYAEVGKGLFVDQKWVDLALCFFESIHVLRHKGCNMAYWNLHERILDSNLLVNGKEQLIFYHFSGLDINNLNVISKIQKKYTLENRKDLQSLFESYKQKVLANGYEKAKQCQYKYGFYDNGIKIGLLARRLYPLVSNRFPNPFSTGSGSYYEFIKKKHLLEKSVEMWYGSKITREDARTKIKYANKMLKLALLFLGPDRYNALMKYLSYISIIRNQDFLIG